MEMGQVQCWHSQWFVIRRAESLGKKEEGSVPSRQVLCAVCRAALPQAVTGAMDRHVGPGAHKPTRPLQVLNLPAETAVQGSAAPLMMDRDGSVNE